MFNNYLKNKLFSKKDDFVSKETILLFIQYL